MDIRGCPCFAHACIHAVPVKHPCTHSVALCMHACSAYVHALCTPYMQRPGDVAVRACFLDPASGLGIFATAPLAKRISGRAAEVRVVAGESACSGTCLFVLCVD